MSFDEMCAILEDSELPLGIFHTIVPEDVCNPWSEFWVEIYNPQKYYVRLSWRHRMSGNTREDFAGKLWGHSIRKLLTADSRFDAYKSIWTFEAAPLRPAQKVAKPRREQPLKPPPDVRPEPIKPEPIKTRPSARARPGKRSSVIYAIEAQGLNRVKIGITRYRAQNRLGPLQIGSAVPLALVAFWPGDFSDERDIHMRFAEERLHGEWFEFSPRIRAFLKTVPQGTDPCPPVVRPGRQAKSGVVDTGKKPASPSIKEVLKDW